MMERPIIIIGAGASGLAAARTLSQAKILVLLVEARARIGGRIASIIDPQFQLPVELGAEFVHGMPPETLETLDRHRVPLVEIDGEHLRLHNGQIVPGNEWVSVDRIMNALPKPRKGPDLSFNDFVKTLANPNAPETNMARAFVEGFNAADADKISAQSLSIAQDAETTIAGERQFRLANIPYEALPNALLSECPQAFCTLKLNCSVTKIEWQKNRVLCTANDGERLESERVLVTVPLPVLKNSRLRFEPPLPDEKLDAMRLIETGTAQRITFSFKSVFWENLSSECQLNGVSFMQAVEPPFRTWWTMYPLRAPILVAWNAGRSAIHGIDSAELVRIALNKLSEMLGLTQEFIEQQLVSYHTHDWDNDCWSGGAYSYTCVNGIDAPTALHEPIASTIFFAGEATVANGHIGTVHGAIASGIRAAQEIIQSI